MTQDTEQDTKPMQIDRRRVLAGSAAMLSFLTWSPEIRAMALEETLIINRTALPVREATSPLSFDLFYDLSRYITARSELNQSAALELFEYFRKEEWGWFIAARVYTNIRKELKITTVSVPEILSKNRFPELDQWYCRHILDAWYEGMYRYDGSEVRLIYDKALMWTVLEDVLPVQGLSDKEYGYWEEPPEGVSVE